MIAVSTVCYFGAFRAFQPHDYRISMPDVIASCALDVLFLSTLLLLPLLMRPLMIKLGRTCSLIAIGFLQLLVLQFIFASHLYQQRTGSELTFELVLFALNNLADLTGLLAEGNGDAKSIFYLFQPFTMIVIGWALAWVCAKQRSVWVSRSGIAIVSVCIAGALGVIWCGYGSIGWTSILGSAVLPGHILFP